MAEAREQQAALALVAKRKRDVRRVEDRHVLESHDDLVRHALLGLGVELERGGLNQPILIAGRTGRVAHPRKLRLAVGLHRDVLGEAAAVAVEDLEISLVEFGAAERIVDAGVALDAELRVLEVDRALAPSPCRSSGRK